MPELLTEDDYANLPEDDEDAFLALEAICRRRMEALINQTHQDEGVEPLWDSYIAIVSSAAESCDIEGIVDASFETKPYDRYRQFKERVDKTVTKLRLRGRNRNRPYSVQLSSKTRITIAHHIAILRQAIQEADLEDSRRSALLAKLGELEQEVSGNRRVSFSKFMSVLAPVAAVVASLTTVIANGDKVVTSVTSIMRLIGQDKEAEEEGALLRLAPPPRALPAPSAPSVPTPAHRNSSPNPSGQNARRPGADLDDDIPF